MVFINKSLLAGLFALAGTGALASVVERASCSIPTYGPFKLYSVSDGPDGTSLLNLVDMGTDENNNTLSTLTTCDTCGQTPVYWNLRGSVLSPVFNYALVIDPSHETINYPLPYGKVDFVTGKTADITPAPIYCAEKNSTSSGAKPQLLAANGHTDLFSICSFIGTPGPAHRRDIYYNQTSSGVALNCQSTKLVIQSLS